MSELSCIDKKDVIELENKEVKKIIKEFSEKGSWGLLLDAKELWNNLEKEDVLNKMKSYNVLHEEILACLEAVEKNDRKAYKLIVDLYKKIKELEKDADIHANGQSTALCMLAKKFLDNKWKLDPNEKIVECVVLTNELKRTKDLVDTLNQRLEKSIDSFNSLQEDYQTLRKDNQKLQEDYQTLRKDNQKLQEGIQNLQQSVYDLKYKNLELQETMRRVLHENQGLKYMISDMQERSDQRLRQVVEENRRSMQRMLIEMLR